MEIYRTRLDRKTGSEFCFARFSEERMSCLNIPVISDCVVGNTRLSNVGLNRQVGGNPLHCTCCSGQVDNQATLKIQTPDQEFLQDLCKNPHF